VRGASRCVRLRRRPNRSKQADGRTQHCAADRCPIRGRLCSRSGGFRPGRRPVADAANAAGSELHRRAGLPNRRSFRLSRPHGLATTSAISREVRRRHTPVHRSQRSAAFIRTGSDGTPDQRWPKCVYVETHSRFRRAFDSVWKTASRASNSFQMWFASSTSACTFSSQATDAPSRSLKLPPSSSRASCWLAATV
jgi:hypothetical protein